MSTLHTRVGLQPSILAPKLIKLERCGRYEDALGLIADDWRSLDAPVGIAEMEPADAAHLQLRYGSLVGFYGHSCNISGSQARSKDLLTNARELFLDLAEIERVAECENFIALAYWRTGEHKEAEAWVEQALSYDLGPESDVRLYTLLVKSLILLSKKEHQENLVHCRLYEDDFRCFGDAFLNGSLCSNVGISLKDLSRSAEALSYFNLARSFHEKSRHRTCRAIVENNLALLYKDMRQFPMAHVSADNAISIYRKIGDKVRQGSSLETKTQIFLAEENFDRAMATIDKSIAVLRKSENLAYLAESIATKAKIFVARDNFADAVLSLLEAVDIMRNQAGDDAARELIDEFEAVVKASKVEPGAGGVSAQPAEVELVIPPSIAKHTDFKGVWIHNSYLDSIGVSQGSLALVANEPLKRGEPGAVMDLESGEVSCGFYDADFGIICLEGRGSEPQLFDEDKVTILGKIVGVCNSGRDADGKMVVEPIDC